MSTNGCAVSTASAHAQKVVALIVVMKQEAIALQPMSMMILNAVASFWYNRQQSEGKALTAFTVEIGEVDLTGITLPESAGSEDQGWVARVCDTSGVAEVVVWLHHGQIELLPPSTSQA
jgi:hypothetical protein